MKRYILPEKMLTYMTHATKHTFGHQFFSKFKLLDPPDDPSIYIVEFPVELQHCNAGKTLHGGVTSTLVDLVTTLGLTSNCPNLRMNVSVSLQTDFLKGVSPGEKIKLISKTNRVGKTMGFTTCTIFNEKEEMISSASHVKAFIDKPLKEEIEKFFANQRNSSQNN